MKGKLTQEVDFKRYRLSDTNPALITLLDKHKAVFAEGLGTVKTNHAKLHLRSSATPKFSKARSIPFVIKDIIGAKLDSLEAAGILEKVSHSDWATPIVTVPKGASKLFFPK